MSEAIPKRVSEAVQRILVIAGLAPPLTFVALRREKYGPTCHRVCWALGVLPEGGLEVYDYQLRRARKLRLVHLVEHASGESFPPRLWSAITPGETRRFEGNPERLAVDHTIGLALTELGRATFTALTLAEEARSGEPPFA